jgi:HlyD family secretion protein
MRFLRPILVVVILITLGVLYHQYFRGDEAAENPALEEKPAVKPVRVQVAPAFVGELVQYVTASGVTEAVREVEIKPLVSGRVVQVAVRDGQPVRKGELLVQLDDREYQIAFREARSQLLSAQAEYALRMEDRQPIVRDSLPLGTNGFHELSERYRQALAAYREGTLNDEEFRKIEREYRAAEVFSGQQRDELIAQQSGLSAAEAQFDRAKYQLENCRIPAPFSGIVGDVQVHPGDYISAGQTLLRLVDLSRLKLQLEVLESEMGNIRRGETIEARFAAFPDTVFRGQIIGINPTVNPETRTGTVIAEIPNPGALLKSGMFATVRIAVNRYPNRLLVPRAAVVERDRRQLVFIVRDGKAFWCYVETGLENDDYVEVVSSAFDLKPGEPVIVDGHFALAHNAPVEVDERKKDE